MSGQQVKMMIGIVVIAGGSTALFVLMIVCSLLCYCRLYHWYNGEGSGDSIIERKVSRIAEESEEKTMKSSEAANGRMQNGIY